MAVLPILTYPDHRLKQVSEPVDLSDGSLEEMIQDLLDTLDGSPGCVGIAAPQAGLNKRIIIIDAARNPRIDSKLGRLILINPEILKQEGEVTAREGCLSIPDLTANVKRAERIEARALDITGNTRSIEASGFEARVLLHEYDHLEGILFLDRVSSLKTDVFRRKNYGKAR